MNVDKVIAEGMDHLDKLPDKVQQTTSEMRELDIKCTDLLKKININVVAYAKAMTRMNKDQKNHHIKEIGKMYDQAEKLSRAKLALAADLYDSVDQDISMMNKTTKKLEAGARGVDKEPGTSDKNRRKRKESASHSAAVPFLNVPSVEMPIDPNEPVYCTCRQVSFGEMVCCDNLDCTVEWFHYNCVGMESGPPQKVKWFCEVCRPSFKHIANQWDYEANEPPKTNKQ